MVLRRDHFIAVGDQQLDDLAETGSVGPQAMCEDNAGFAGHAAPPRAVLLPRCSSSADRTLAFISRPQRASAKPLLSLAGHRVRPVAKIVNVLWRENSARRWALRPPP